MYGQIYTLPFKSIEENDYLVVIEKDGFTGSSTELTGSTSPFTVETSLDSPLSPYRLSTATLKIFGGDYLQNLFTPNPQGVRVKLLKNGSVEWIGFVTNDTYSQDYSNIEFEYEIELVNPLSTLKYKKFSINLDTITFYQLIVDAIKATNSEITKLYLPTVITNTSNQNIYELVSTSSYNYIDEQGKEMNYYEILEEIAKYLCLTITIDKNIVYFLDYIGISKGYNSYYGYTFNSNGTITKATITLPNSNTIQALGYSGDNSKLQINSGKNKAKVTCSLFDIDDILPEFDDKGTTFIDMEKTTNIQKDNKEFHEIRRYYSTNKFDMYKYTYNIANVSLNPEQINNGKLASDEIGSMFIRSAKYDANDIPSSLNFKNELFVKRYMNIGNQPARTLNMTKPILSLKSPKQIIIHNDVYFCISLKVEISQRLWSESVSIFKPKNDTILYVWAKFRIGDNYWNGVNWTTNSSVFSMPITVKKDEQMNEVFLSLDNNNTFETGVGDLDGYTFKADSMLIGNCEFTLYDFEDSNKVDIFRTLQLDAYNRFKDIEVTYGIPNEQSIYNDYIDKEKKNDIVYENKISDTYVEEANEVDLKICTFPDNYTKLCYSSTFINNDFLKTLKYTPLNITDKPESIIINKTVEYFKEPKYEVSIPINNKVIYPYSTITDSNLAGKKFIYAGNEIDYEYEKNTITLIEI